jgi:hyperosmotically inducible protein
MSDHLEAIRTASRVSGVRRVSSEIKSPDTLGDEEIRHMETSKGAPDKGSPDKPGIGDAASDMYITTATKLRLIADSETPALDINVDTTDGVVTLFGMVPTEKAKQAAEADARKVSGVKQVVNELQIVPAQAKETTKANDKDLQQAIEQALEKRTDLADASITVEVKDAVARLSGTVNSENDRLTAAITARSTRGVRSVLWNDLQVSSAKR